MKKTDLFVQKIGSSFFDNDILPQSNSACAQKFFKRRFLRVARNASTHERSVPNSAPSSFSSKIFAEILAQDKKCADFATGIYKT